MAGRYLMPHSGRTFAVCVAAWLLASSQAGPALASSNVPPADETPESTRLEVLASILRMPIVDHEFVARNRPDAPADDVNAPVTTADYLTPGVESAVRKVFEEGPEKSSEPLPEDEPALDADENPTIKARVPGLSDSDLERYKRQMYRRDI